MTDDNYKTMRVPADDWRDAKAQKEAAGRTWGEQIVRPDGDGDKTSTTGADGVEDVLQRLDDLEAQLPRKVAEELQR